ncbi:hypothetical protein ACFLUE_02495 [Chloroflexota bacterium]
MIGGNYSTFPKPIVLGVLALVGICIGDWGYIMAIVAGAIALLYLGKDILRGLWWPFRVIQYRLQNGETPFPSPQAIKKTHVLSYFEGCPQQKKMTISKAGKYHLFVQLRPFLPVVYKSVEMGFLGASDNRPKMTEFKDANPEFCESWEKAERGDGMRGWYSNPINVSPGRDIYYVASFETRGKWEGKFSMRFDRVGMWAKAIRTNCRVP